MEDNITTETKDTETETKTYTQEEIDALIEQKAQSQIDYRVTQALKTQKKNLEKEYAKKFSLSKLDDEARAKAELEDRNKELEEQIAQMTIEKQRSDLKSTLSTRGLDARFADLLNIVDDTEANQKVIADFDKLWKAAVNAEVEKRISTNAPKHNMSNPSEMTKEAYTKMSLGEQTAFIQANPEFKSTISKWFN